MKFKSKELLISAIDKIGIGICKSSTLKQLTRGHPHYRLNICLKHLFPSRQITMLEVGVNTGSSIDNILKNFPDSTVYGIEPIEKLMPFLKNKYGKRVKLFNHGLGSVTGEGTLNITKSIELTSQLTPNSSYQRQSQSKYLEDNVLSVESTQKFKIITGDTFITENSIDSIDLLSLNTQGTELEILKGFSSVLRQGNIKLIEIEVDMSNRYLGDKFSILDLEQLMAGYGYKLFDVLMAKDLNPIGLTMMDLLYVHSSIDIER